MAVALAESPVRVAVGRERFYFWMAATCLAVGVMGFAPSYWIRLAGGGLDVPPLTHIHALFFYGWLLFFMKQTSLASSGAVARHRELGIAGVALATGMFFVGTGMAFSSLRQSMAAGFGDAALAFSVVPFTGIVLFAVMFGIAIANVKRPEIHKRLILVATVSILQAAVGRWFLLFLAPPLPPGGHAKPAAGDRLRDSRPGDGPVDRRRDDSRPAHARQRSSGLLDRGRSTARGAGPPRAAQHVARLDCDRAMAADAGAVGGHSRPFPCGDGPFRLRAQRVQASCGATSPALAHRPLAIVTSERTPTPRHT